MMLGQPARRFLGVGAGVDGFGAEVDTAFEQGLAAAAEAPRHVALGHRRIGPGDQHALGLALAEHLDAMLDPPATAGQDHDRVRRRQPCVGRLAQSEREQDEAERIENCEQRGAPGDHKVWRNAARTAVRATQVDSAVKAIGTRARRTRSPGDSEAPPVSSPAKDALAASSPRTRAAAAPPSKLPNRASTAILRWNRWVIWKSVAPMPCITSMVKRWVSSAPRAASTTAATAAPPSSSTKVKASHCSALSDLTKGPRLSL